MKSLFAMVLCTLFLLLGAAQAQTDDFNVAAGRTVSHSRAPADNYPDADGLKLTDGSFDFAWGDMVGFEGPDPVALVIDLEQTYEELSYVALKLMYSAPSGVALPASFIVSVSEDGVLYEDLGMATRYLEGEVGNDTIGTLVWSDEDYPGYGRYLRVELRPGGDGWTMVAEVIVGDGAVPAELLPAASGAAPASADPVVVSLGRPYGLSPEPAMAYPDDDGVKVTDGAYAYSWADQVGFDTPAFNPVVVIDLGERVEGITRVGGVFMRSFASAVNFPNSLVVSVSDDGELFSDVGLAVRTVPDPFLNEFMNAIYWQDLESPVAGRFVKVEIRPRGASWTMLAEIVVQTGAAVPEVEEE